MIEDVFTSVCCNKNATVSVSRGSGFCEIPSYSCRKQNLIISRFSSYELKHHFNKYQSMFSQVILLTNRHTGPNYNQLQWHKVSMEKLA